MDGSGPLDVQGSVVFRHGVLAIRLLTQFDVSDAVAALFEIGDLGGSVVRRPVKHSDRNHRWEIVGESAGKEEIEAAVLVASGGVHVSGRVPGID